MTHVRSTLLGSSMQIVRERALLDRYLDALPRAYHDAMLTMIAGQWFPIELALAHYDRELWPLLHAHLCP